MNVGRSSSNNQARSGAIKNKKQNKNAAATPVKKNDTKSSAIINKQQNKNAVKAPSSQALDRSTMTTQQALGPLMTPSQKPLQKASLTAASINIDNDMTGMIKALIQIVSLLITSLATKPAAKDSALSQSLDGPVSGLNNQADNTTDKPQQKTWMDLTMQTIAQASAESALKDKAANPLSPPPNKVLESFISAFSIPSVNTNSNPVPPSPAKSLETPAKALESFISAFSIPAVNTNSNPVNPPAAQAVESFTPGAVLPNLKNTAADPKQKLRLDNTLKAISNDPEGSKLLEAAKAKGYTIEVGDPLAAAGGSLDKGSVSCNHCKAAMDAGTQVNGVTLPSQKKIIINPKAQDFEKTVVHELVHAATDGDGNSQQEEGIADVVGYRVANRITAKAQPGDTRSIYENKMKNYRELQGSNSIRDTLASIGIDAGI